MDNYKILTDKDNIILKKKDNKFILETKKKVKLPCDIINLVENLEIYNLFKLLNEKLISKCKIIKNKSNSDVIICLNNIIKNSDEDDGSDENFYITFTNNLNKKDPQTIVLDGKKNHINLNKEGWKKIEIDNVLIQVNLIQDELKINLSFDYIGEKMPIYAENTLGLVFRKIIKNLVLYYSN